MFERWNSLHNPHNASVTEGGTLGVQGQSCCQRGGVSPLPSSLQTAVSLCVLSSFPNAVHVPRGLCQLCIAQFCLCKNIANFFVVVWRQRGRGRNHSDITLCCVCSHSFLPSTGVIYLPASSQSLVDLGACPTNFHGGRWKLLFWAVKGTIDFCICCFSCGF